MKPATRPRLTTIIVVALCGILAIWGWDAVRFLMEMHEMPDMMRRRHVEATTCIQAIYRFAAANQAWPDDEQFSKLAQGCGLSPDWDYMYAPPPDSNTALILHGPYHSALVYYFPANTSAEPSKQWIFDIEGSKWYFDATLEYSSPPEG